MDGRVFLQYSYLSILCLDKKMEISKECNCLYKYYYETWNSYLNVSLLKVVVLIPIIMKIIITIVIIIMMMIIIIII